MLNYVVRRLLLFIPTIVGVSLLAFFISSAAPGDPVDRLVTARQSSGAAGITSGNLKEQKAYWRKKLGLDLPLFYFSLSTLSMPDTLYKVSVKEEREALERLVLKCGNWKAVSDYYHSLEYVQKSHLNWLAELSPEARKGELSTAYQAILTLKSDHREEVILSKQENLKQFYQEAGAGEQLKHVEKVAEKYRSLEELATQWKNYVPVITFYGNNQYHRWLFGDGNWLTRKDGQFTRGIIRGDFGISYRTKLPVSQVIGRSVFWSALLAIISVVIAYGISIPIGIKAAARKGSRFDRLSGYVLFLLYSLPSFWVAVLLLMFFANPSIFPGNEALLPASGVKPSSGYPENAGIWDRIAITIPYLILPTICYTYGSFAFLSRTMRSSMLEVSRQDYIRTAKAKGMSNYRIYYRHGIKNALLPIITVFANVFPMAIGGAVILETIFTIPGMGYEIFTAIHTRDYPMITAVFVLTGVLVMIGYLVSDILYALADPRISFSGKKQ